MSLFMLDQLMDKFGNHYCEQLLDSLRRAGTLHMEFKTRHNFRKMLLFLTDASIAHLYQDSTISIHVAREEITALSLQLANALSPADQSWVQVRFQADGTQTEGAGALRCSLRNFLARAQSMWLTNMIRRNHLTSVFQPIVCCEDVRKVFAYEALMRGTDERGTVLPAQMLEVARGADLLFQLDQYTRRMNILNAARYNISTKLFINVTPLAIYDAMSGLPGALRQLERVGLNPHQIVLEIIESEQVSDITHIKETLQCYRECGFEVAVDDFGAGYSSFKMLHELRPEYIKLDMDIIRNVHLDRYRATLALKLIEAAQELGIKSIMEGVESEGEYDWVRRHGANFVQGFYISKPATPPPFMFADFDPSMAGLATIDERMARLA